MRAVLGHLGPSFRRRVALLFSCTALLMLGVGLLAAGNAGAQGHPPPRSDLAVNKCLTFGEDVETGGAVEPCAEAQPTGEPPNPQTLPVEVRNTSYEVYLIRVRNNGPDAVPSGWSLGGQFVGYASVNIADTEALNGGGVNAGNSDCAQTAVPTPIGPGTWTCLGRVAIPADGFVDVYIAYNAPGGTQCLDTPLEPLCQAFPRGNAVSVATPPGVTDTEGGNNSDQSGTAGGRKTPPGPGAPPPPPPNGHARPQCSDGIDNDRDGRTDFGPNRFHNDPQCTSAQDNDESH